MEIAKHSEGSQSTVQYGDEATLINLDEQPGRVAKLNGEEYLFFSGYAYLGVQQVAAFTDLVKQGIEKYGWGFPSSRISNTRLQLFDAFEKKLSSLTGFNETVVTSTGYTAGRMAVQLFSHKANFLVAPNAHVAISDGLSKFQNSYDNWKNFVVSTLNEQKQYSLPVIVADTVNPLKGEKNDLSFLQYIETKCICIVDDSHGIGLTGNNGSGIANELPDNPNIDFLLVFSLSKAFGLNGGAISSNNTSLIAQLRNLPAYTGGTAMSPALMFAFNNAEEIYRQQRRKLEENISYFNDLVRNKKSIVHPDKSLPVFLFSAEIDEEELLRNKVIISSFAYPDPKGKKIQRIVVNALHTKEDLTQLAALIK